MKPIIRLALNPAALFFVGQGDDRVAQMSVPIEPPFRIGRNPDVELCLPCYSVSGMHAEITLEDGHYWLDDLDSTNGTYVNAVRIENKTRLNENDTIQFGTTVFQVARDTESGFSERSHNRPGSEMSPEQNERFDRLMGGSVVPFFQPIQRIAGPDRDIVGYEVLGRSRLFGLRTPAQMFAAAHLFEMEAELSRVLRKQGIMIADANLPPDLALYVNTHPAELECEGLEESLFEIRDSHPTRPIKLEVHESLLNDTERFVELCPILQTLDIQLAFHDFGAGQIRLAELSEVSPEVVKFDVNLVQGINKATSKRQQFVASLVKMVSELGITPLAECVEQTGEHETLQQLGFQLGQGFLYARPCPIAECAEPRTSMQTVNYKNLVPQVKSFLPQTPTVLVDDIAEDSTGHKDADWLLSQPEHHYTIQVLSAISKERALEHISQQENPEQFAVFCKHGKTRMLYIVVFGSFADRTTAKAAANKLANSTISPWIRIYSSIHAEIRSSIRA